MEFPAGLNDQGENKANCGGLDNQTKGIFIVKTFKLMKALCDEPSFLTLERSISTLFGKKHPFATNNIGARRRRNKGLGTVCEKSMKLFFHCCGPLGIFGGLGTGGRRFRDRRCGGKRGLGRRPTNCAIFETTRSKNLVTGMSDNGRVRI